MDEQEKDRMDRQKNLQEHEKKHGPVPVPGFEPQKPKKQPASEKSASQKQPWHRAPHTPYAGWNI